MPIEYNDKEIGGTVNGYRQLLALEFLHLFFNYSWTKSCSFIFLYFTWSRIIRIKRNLRARSGVAIEWLFYFHLLIDISRPYYLYLLPIICNGLEIIKRWERNSHWLPPCYRINSISLILWNVWPGPLISYLLYLL